MSTTIVRTSAQSEDPSGWTVIKVENTSTIITPRELWENMKARPGWALLGLTLGAIIGFGVQSLLL